MPKPLDILKHFPNFYQATDQKKLLYLVADCIVSRIQGIENDMMEIMKSHWIKTVENIDDLEKIAALYGIEREEYENIEQFRIKVQDIIRLYLAGPGTVPSIIEFTAIALRKYGVEIKRDKDGNPEFTHPEDDKSRTRVEIYFKGSENSGETNEDFIEVQENPIKEKKYTENNIKHHQEWFLENYGFFSSYPEITLQGCETRTVNPVLFNRITGHAFGFRGIVPEKSVLRITATREGFLDSAELDEKDVKNSMFSLKGSQFNRCNFDEESSIFAIYKPERAFNEIGFAETLEGKKNPPDFEIPLPIIPVGESEWEFRIGKSEFNGSKFDKDAFTFPNNLSSFFDVAHFDNSGFPIGYSAGLEMKWKEHQRATFVLILPCSLGKKQINSTHSWEQERQFMEPLQSVKKMIERVKPAGVYMPDPVYGTAPKS